MCATEQNRVQVIEEALICETCCNKTLFIKDIVSPNLIHPSVNQRFKPDLKSWYDFDPNSDWDPLLHVQGDLTCSTGHSNRYGRLGFDATATATVPGHYFALYL
jgi:hypothetical protein